MKNSFGNQFLTLFNPFLKVLENFRKTFKTFSEEYPNTAQNIQLTCIYCCAVIDLVHSVLNNVFSLGYIPEFLQWIFPLLKSILMSPFFQIWASPEKVFFLSYVVIEFMVIRSTFKFSKLIKYNILMLFSLLMIQGLVISYWDLFFHRQITTSASQWIFGDGMFIYTDRYLGFCFFFFTFIIFTYTYAYLLWKALQGKLSTLPIQGLEMITDSVAFWLRIKTPTMRYGKKKKKDENE